MHTMTVDGRKIAVVEAQTPVLTDVETALDLVMTAQYEAGTNRIAMDKRGISEDFFILSRGLAGEILQKFINYQIKFAIYGDYSGYTSKPLRDFIVESNRGKDVFFVATQEEAIQKLANAK